MIMLVQNDMGESKDEEGIWTSQNANAHGGIASYILITRCALCDQCIVEYDHFMTLQEINLEIKAN